MSLYEGMFMVDNRQANRDWEGVIETLTSLVTKHGGEVLRTVKWGERRLAYEVAGRRRATYVQVYFNCSGDGVNRIYRECELTELVHRALILKITELPPEDAPTGEDIPDNLRQRAPRGPARGRRGPDTYRRHRDDDKDDEDDDSSDDEDIDDDDMSADEEESQDTNDETPEDEEDDDK